MTLQFLIDLQAIWKSNLGDFFFMKQLPQIIMVSSCVMIIKLAQKNSTLFVNLLNNDFFCTPVEHKLNVKNVFLIKWLDFASLQIIIGGAKQLPLGKAAKTPK